MLRLHMLCATLLMATSIATTRGAAHEIYVDPLGGDADTATVSEGSTAVRTVHAAAVAVRAILLREPAAEVYVTLSPGE
jgi:hypothetical protein